MKELSVRVSVLINSGLFVASSFVSSSSVSTTSSPCLQSIGRNESEELKFKLRVLAYCRVTLTWTQRPINNLSLLV